MIEIFLKNICILYCIFMEIINNALNLIFDIVKKLDCDTRTNIYIGVTGILIAVVIFIAEIISNKKIEIYKNLVLEKTRLIKNVRNMIITMAIIWLGEIVNPQNSEIIYILEQIVIDIVIFVSMFQTFQTFLEVIKLNTNKEYFDNQLKKYLYSKIENNISAKEKQQKMLNEKNEEFFKFIKNSKIFKFEPYSFVLEDDYDTLNSNKYGYIESYDYYILNKIEENLKVQIKNTENGDNSAESISNKNPEIYICKKIGDKCGNGFPIAYYKNVKDELINMVNKSLTIDSKNYIDCDSEISKIIDDIFAVAFQNPLNIDNENILFNLYEFICKNKYESIIATFLDKIYQEYIGINSIKENESFCKFLNKLMMSSFNNDRYDDFNRIGIYITRLYIERMKTEGTDLKYIAYKYANNVFIFNNYSIKRKGDYRYYDIIMSNLLLIIKEYLRRKNIEAILVIFDNIHFEKNNYYIEKNFNNFDIVNFQFIIAVIYFVLYMYKEEEKNNKEIDKSFIDNISELINVLKYKFFELYDMWDTMLKFNKFSKKKSQITHIIENVDFDSDSHKYKNSWSWSPMDINEVLKCMIYMFGIRYVNIEKINENDINREDKYKYERLLELFKNQTFKELEKKYEYDSRCKTNAIQLISKVIEIAQKKEDEYELNAEIDEEKVKRFRDILIKSSNKKSKIEELIYNIGKTKESEIKLKRTFGISELIPRNWFIKDEYNNIYTDNVAEEFGESFKRGIKKEIIEYIINQSVIYENTLQDIISSISDSNDYVLLANRNALYNTTYSYDNEHVNINGKKIYTIFTLEIENFILVNKQALPNIELCKFDDSYDKNNINGNIYIEITDCSGDEQLREKIINGNEWLKEKGNLEEQDNYLKTMCDFKVFKAYRIIESNIKDSYIIKR